MERGCDEIELDLGLSIGGTFNRKETCVNVVGNNGDDDDDDGDGGCLHDSRKREMHALRRQEAKKKRDEKQQRKCKGKKNERESAKEEDERDCKRERVQDLHVSEDNKDLSLNLSNENPRGGFQPFVHPHYPYQPMQYFSFPNGYAFGPYVMPCWTPEATSSGNVATLPVRPLGSRSFVPYQAPAGYALGDDRKENESHGSPKGSSSVASQCSSYQGGTSSTESRSHSCRSKPDSKLNVTISKHTRDHHEQTDNSIQAPHAQMINDATFSEKKLETAGAPESSSTKREEELKSVDPLDPSKRTVSSIENPATDPVIETNNGHIGKSPKPQVRNHNSPILAQMPYVSTTGPNGKKITGFLYRYTKAEVSIICVCHGTSFSPSEFILHAGGTDVTNPLRHITVIPSAFSMSS